MYRILEQRMRAAIAKVRGEAAHRKETTPSDPAAEAFEYSAKVFEQELNEALRDTERLTPTQYGEAHGVTAQTVTRWIRVGELEAEETANGYLIARDAVRVERPRKVG